MEKGDGQREQLTDWDG